MYVRFELLFSLIDRIYAAALDPQLLKLIAASHLQARLGYGGSQQQC